ncbi:MAG: deoxynucleoside kinase [Bacteroidales bacterium]|nr:deoxynucleoside kinase [Bacteroidales bacterium]
MVKIKYNYIAIEGNIGAGKTSLAKMIANQFNAKLILEQFEDNSFLPKFYKDPSKYAFPLEMSFLADRYHQLKELLTLRDLFKTFTISDYFINKSLIFAKKTLQNDEFSLYVKLFDIINASLPKPDLLVYLYMDVDNLKKNILKRGRSYEKNIEISYLEKIQSGYLDYIKQQKNMRILILNTNNIDFINNNKEYKDIINILSNEYTQEIHRITLG